MFGNTWAWSCTKVCCWLCSSTVACVAPAGVNKSRMCIWTEESQSLKQCLSTWDLSPLQGVFLPRAEQSKKSLLLGFVLVFFTDPNAVGNFRENPQKGFLLRLYCELVVRENYAVILRDTIKLSCRLGPRQLEAILNAHFTLCVSQLLTFHERFLTFN